MLRFRVSESLSVDEFLQVGEHCANLIRQRAGEMHMDLTSAQRVLDFGCGCGRTIRWLIRDGGMELHGVDVDSQAIDWCREHFAAGHFLATGPEPPLPYTTGYFDVVYCVSVFTHLDEAMQDRWLPELKRVLKPGGLLLLTIHGENASAGLDPTSSGTLRIDGLLHRRSSKLKGLVPDWYHTTWHTREYITTKVATWFEDVRYSTVSDGLQDFVMARKASDHA